MVEDGETGMHPWSVLGAPITGAIGRSAVEVAIGSRKQGLRLGKGQHLHGIVGNRGEGDLRCRVGADQAIAHRNVQQSAQAEIGTTHRGGAALGIDELVDPGLDPCSGELINPNRAQVGVDIEPEDLGITVVGAGPPSALDDIAEPDHAELRNGGLFGIDVKPFSTLLFELGSFGEHLALGLATDTLPFAGLVRREVVDPPFALRIIGQGALAPGASFGHRTAPFVVRWCRVYIRPGVMRRG
jgi:hypothetical protein